MGDRIVINRNKKVKVNAKLAEDNEVVKDSRFQNLFKDKNFEIDYTSELYKMTHPVC